MISHLAGIELMIHHATARAVLVSTGADNESAVWLPKEPLEFEEAIVIGQARIVTMPESLAIEKGLV